MKTEDEIYKELVEKKLKESDGPFEFEGWNCDNLDSDWNGGVPCTGWDGRDRRCNCGNRRVSWVLSDDNTYVYAEAY